MNGTGLFERSCCSAVASGITIARCYRDPSQNAVAFVTFREQLKTSDLSLAEFGVLEALLHKGPVPLNLLAELVLTSAPGMTYTVKGLEKRELLRRRSSTEDQRVVVAELTPAGRMLIEKVFPEHLKVMQCAMGGLNRTQKRQAADLLKTLRRAVP